MKTANAVITWNVLLTLSFLNHILVDVRWVLGKARRLDSVLVSFKHIVSKTLLIIVYLHDFNRLSSYWKRDIIPCPTKMFHENGPGNCLLR